jgi:crotonobetainyl-CoA:carnitine CoA-transferase CaiB-like acyl-CoA transferase
MKALAGLRILDLTHMLSGPYCTMMLADLGAEVIKIEPPVSGEGTRMLLAHDPEHSVDGVGAYFLTLGRNKLSMSLDLKHEEGMSIFRDLVRVADIVVYNFRAGVGERLGLHYDHLKAINPRIITCSITGFGETGPNKDFTSFDMVAQATGGGMSVTGDGSTPLRSGIPIGDLGGGMMATIGILAAVQSRHTTGQGQHCDISMQDAQISLLNYMATMFFLSGKQPAATGNSHFVHVPYDSFPAADQHIIIAVITDPLWEKLVQALSLQSELAGGEYARQPGRLAAKEKITAILSQKLQTASASHWLKILRAHGIPCAPVNDLRAALQDPHVLARDMVVDVPLGNGQKIRQPGIPIKLSACDHSIFAPPPRVGQHNKEILGNLLGVDEDRQAELQSHGTI